MAKFDAASDERARARHQRVDIRVGNTSAMSLLLLRRHGPGALVGGHKVVAGEISVGTLTTFLTFMTILQMPVRQLGLMVNSFSRASTCGTASSASSTSTSRSPTRPDATALAVTDGTLRFENVGFAYAGRAAGRRCRDISFEARPRRDHRHRRPAGQRQVDHRAPDPALLRRELRRITIDGQDIRDVTLQSLRQAVAVVQQDGFLFTTTLENNIAYADPWAQRAAHRARQRLGAAARLRPRPARRLPHRGRRARRLALRRPAPAPLDRPQPDAEARGDGLRRFDRRHRRRHRAAHPRRR